MSGDRMERLYARRRFGMRPGLDSMRALLGRLGHPEEGLAIVHIAGTNGKGSVSAMVSEILAAGGCRVGRYTSPHLLRFNERIFVDGRPVDDAALQAALDVVERAAVAMEAEGGQPITFFECATAVACIIFQQAGIRLAVMETGLGGRLDATAVMTPLVSVITRIGLDHCEQLGDTIEAIAGEKAGIVKPGRPVVCGTMPDDARDVIRQTAARQRCAFLNAAEEIGVTRTSMSLEGLTVRITTPARDMGSVHVPLAGIYQVENIATAVAAVETVAQQLDVELSDDAIRTGLARVCWPGRFQLAVKDPPVVVDGAHNPDAAAALVESLRRLKLKRPVGLVAGLCADKDAGAFVRLMAPVAARAWAVPVPSARTLPAVETAALMRAAGIKEVAVSEVSDALKAAQSWAREAGGLVLVCGSLFLAGEALALLDAYPWPLDDPHRLADPNESIKPL